MHLPVSSPTVGHLREVGPYCVLFTADYCSPGLVPTEHALGHWLLRLGSSIHEVSGARLVPAGSGSWRDRFVRHSRTWMTPWPAGLLTAATRALFRRQGRRSLADPVVALFLVKPARLPEDEVRPEGGGVAR
jgi:hypothetical protein